MKASFAPSSPVAPALDPAEVEALLGRPLLELVLEAALVHREHHQMGQVQCSQLLSIKTGGCPEDCAYCSQSAHHRTPVEREPLLPLEQVVAEAEKARDQGADRFCMGAAWREVRDGAEFERVLEMVREVKALGLETCVTLGMLGARQAERLREAGLDYYNHNLDTGRSFYGEVITTRSLDDRLATLEAVRRAGLRVCTGGIVGLGEPLRARAELLAELASLDPQPESVPINTLVRVAGTPLEAAEPVDWAELVRMVAAARILMPRSVVRLSAGRTELSEEAQALCFLAGVNSIFLGDELLTTPNPSPDSDAALLAKLGLAPMRRERGAASTSGS
ncbi:MAG: biotin synthase BioB [Thermoanaerobaculia bacterium]